jgi:hypothetical protein
MNYIIMISNKEKYLANYRVCLVALYEVEIQSAVAHSQQEVVPHVGE